MADDLDAFFDEVEEVAAAAEEQESTPAEPPRKKAKPTVVGVVVASASEKKKLVPEKKTTPETNNNNMLTVAATSVAAAAPPTAAAVGPMMPPVGPLPGGANNTATTTAAAAATNNTTKPKAHVRTAAGQTWVDPTLDEWPENDFRIFVGNLDPTTTDEQVWQHFSRYPSLLKARVIRDKRKDNVSKGYAFVSMGNALECAKALRELDQSWLGSRPCRLKRCNAADRDLSQVRKKDKKKQKQQKRMGLL